MKIGITEAGDASIDYSWVDKAPDMDMMILITKHVTDKFIDEVMRFANKTIVHATCTGYGQTVVEPRVPAYTVQLEQVRKLIAYGFPADQIVIRIDPIIPTPKGCALVEKIVENIHLDVTRFRVSVLDNYPHVKQRFQSRRIPALYDGNFQASEEDFKFVDLTLSRLKFRFPNITFESCAEPNLSKAEKIGCVAKGDMEKFGLKARKSTKKQRNNCLCAAGKTEMLGHNSFKFCTKYGIPAVDCAAEQKCTNCGCCETYGCPNMCLYCYWKT
jgi:hypothetical protein